MNTKIFHNKAFVGKAYLHDGKYILIECQDLPAEKAKILCEAVLSKEVVINNVNAVRPTAGQDEVAQKFNVHALAAALFILAIQREDGDLFTVLHLLEEFFRLVDVSWGPSPSIPSLQHEFELLVKAQKVEVGDLKIMCKGFNEELGVLEYTVCKLKPPRGSFSDWVDNANKTP